MEYSSDMPNRLALDAALADPYLPTSGDWTYGVDTYDLDLDYRVGANRLTATAVIVATALVRLDRFSLDLAGLTIDKLTVDGERPRKLTTTARKVAVVPATRIEAGSTFTIVVRYRGAPRPVRSSWGDVGWEELADGVLVAGQPCGAASWFPCNDRPSDKAFYRIAVTCESSYSVIANGTLQASSSRSGRTTHVFDSRAPMASYLATVQIGRYRHRRLGTAPVVQNAYFPASLARQVAVDFARLDEMVSTFSDLFGPYPFDDYSVVVTDDVLEIPLEAQGMAVFGRNHVDGHHGGDRLIAHELAHQWFGNSLTVERWQDIWVHEGFACYAEWLWAEESGGVTVADSAHLHHALLGGRPKDLVVGDPGPADMFDDRVYKRGALAVHAMRRAAGDDRFFAALRALTAAHRHGGVTAAGVVDFLGQHAGVDLATVVAPWLDRRALPRF